MNGSVVDLQKYEPKGYCTINKEQEIILKSWKINIYNIDWSQ